jgi:dTDP-4-amino-4,6-dideoxygalactose transaminase
VGSKYEFAHDMVGFNYRMPNLNASLGLSQLEKLDLFVKAKRSVAQHYQQIFSSSNTEFFLEPKGCVSNYWLNAVLMSDKVERDIVLRELNDEMILARPPWQLMTSLPMFKESQRGELSVSKDYADRLLNIPSSVPVQKV